MRLTKNVLIGASFIVAAAALAVVLPMLASGPQGPTAAPTGPLEVMIIRHGEEPKSGPDLDDTGRARAKALAALFQTPFGMPTSIFAAKSSKQSARPVQTCEPLAKSLKLPIDDRFGEQEYKKVAKSILESSKHSGGHVVVCWKRETMSQLAAALGVANPPAEWPAEQYDHVWRIAYVGGKATLTDEVQGIRLPGTAP